MTEQDRERGGLHRYLLRSAEVLRLTAERLDAARFAAAVEAVTTALAAGRPLLVCGNGGSAADAQHITAELVGRFLQERRALKAICLSDNAAVLTAWANDYSYDEVFARQVEAYGEPGAVLLALSTSGNSRNIVAAFETARRMGVTTIALTGAGGGRLAGLADVLLEAASSETPLIQQAHLCLYHQLCAEVEAALAGTQQVAPAA